MDREWSPLAAAANAPHAMGLTAPGLRATRPDTPPGYLAFGFISQIANVLFSVSLQIAK